MTDLRSSIVQKIISSGQYGGRQIVKTERDFALIPLHMLAIDPKCYDSMMDYNNRSYLILKNQVDNYTLNIDTILRPLAHDVGLPFSGPSRLQLMLNNCNNLSSLRLKYYVYHDLVSFAWHQQCSIGDVVSLTYYFQNKFKLKRILELKFDQINKVSQHTFSFAASNFLFGLKNW